jgi:Glyoxalase-like domain
MLGQLPEPGAVFLDHVAHFVPAMDVAAQALERCGFRLTPFTAQTNRVDGSPVAAGTGNRCAMFRRGYVEILAAIADTPLAHQLNDRLARHVGLHLAAFSTADAAAEHRRLAAAAFPVLPLVDMRRPVATEQGEDDARFTIARIAPGTMPEGRMQFLTHHTEPLVWREPDLDHPNGAQALAAIWIAAADPAEPAERFARFTGRRVRREGALTTIALDRGALHFATPEFLAREHGIVPGPPLPYLAAYEIEVASLDRLRRHLDTAGFSQRRIAAGAAVPLPPSIGGTILFRPPAG